MRLLNCRTMQMQVWYGSEIPPYIVLSHRWEREEDEVTLEDFTSGTAESKYGYRKIKKLCKIARKHHCDWVWLDTCCIDKRNSVELYEAINSMYKWYQNSVFCVAYLFDFRFGGHDNLGDSTWFRRCWTLQELISPRTVRFYDKKWSFFGTKEELCRDIAHITGVDEDTLSGADPRRCSVAQRMSWAAGREATRIEDQAYSLLGLFDLSLPMLYGDGERAFLTLQNQILQYSSDSNDQSIFAWSRGLEEGKYHGLLAKNALAFAGCGTTRCTSPISKTYAFSFTGAGFQLNVPTIPYGVNTYLCPLDCTSGELSKEERDCILLEKSAEDDQYSRVCRNGTAIVRVKTSILDAYRTTAQRKLYVQQVPRHIPISMVHGFLLRHVQLPDYTLSELRNIQLRSRDLGQIEANSIPGILAIPMTEWGTAGMVHFPQPRAICHNEHVRCMKLGFDEDFNPACLLSNNTTRSDPDVQPAAFFDSDNRSEKARWANDWLCSGGRVSSDLRYFTPSRLKKGGRRDCNSLLQQQQQRVFRPGRWGHTSVTFSLQDCPPDVNVAGLPKSGPGPWKIWTVDIHATGSYHEDHKLRRKQQRRLALGSMAVAGALAVRATMDYRAHKKESTKAIEQSPRKINAY